LPPSRRIQQGPARRPAPLTRRNLLLAFAATLPLQAHNPYDAFSDGTPDFLRLGRDDERIFRRWFTFLAEAQYFQPKEARPVEIDDCAALIRYAYREALRRHDSRWAAEARVPLLSAAASIAAWHYPDPRMGANLFRIVPGPYDPADLTHHAFAQFADVKTLGRYNTHRVARELDRALPGDLLLYRQDSDHMPFHSMIYLGASQFSRDGGRYVVYHTGPDGADPGIIRRLSTIELLRYPEPEWRPIAANPNFLGIYRWNILRKLS
jgi:uncharacterized protein YfaT (DUF1175 family)